MLARVAKGTVIGLCLTIWGTVGCTRVPSQATVNVKERPVGRITLGTGWDTWDHWWGRQMGHYRLGWNDQQWDSYLSLLKESGADWLRLDLYYGNTEPRNDNDDPEVINWKGFKFDSPQLKSLYKFLDFCEANGIDVYLVYTGLIDNNEYNLDPLTGWLSKTLVEKRYPAPYWERVTNLMTDKRELAENLAATTYHLIKNRKYTCIKQVALYVEPNWEPSLDGYGDTLFLGKLLTKLSIRNQVKILAPHVGTRYLVTKPGDPNFPPPSDFDIYAVEDYEASVNFGTPQEGLKNLSPTYKIDVSELKKKNSSWEAALMEYGSFWCWGATDPLCSYLKTLSSSCLVFELYNSGYGGVLRWAFEPFYHPYDGWGVYKVEGITYPSAVVPKSYGADLDWDVIATVRRAMEQGAKFLKVPQTFEPQRLINGNLRRGSTVYQVEVVDPAPPGKGVYAIAVRDKEGKWHVGLINLYSSALTVGVVFPSNTLPSRLRWEYYDAPLRLLDRVDDWLGNHMPPVEPLRFLFRATGSGIRKARRMLDVSTFPQNSLERVPPQLINNTLFLTLTARSLNFLSEMDRVGTPGDEK